MSDPGWQLALHTDNLARLNCSRDVREELATYAGRAREALGRELAGMYLYGSLPRGCFHPATSDVDVVVITDGACPEELVRQVLQAHERAAIPVDATFVTRSQLEVDETPTPVEFVVKPGGDQRLVRLPEGLGDLLLQRQDVYECDLAVAGPPARELVRPVPWQALAQCLSYLFPHILTRFKNPALMLCRMVYAFANRKLCSKKVAGEWALEELDERWRGLIEMGLAKYAAGIADDCGPDDELRAFEDYCADCITGARESAGGPDETSGGPGPDCPGGSTGQRLA